MKEDFKKYIVYKHVSPSNKVYIGITQQIPERKWQNGYGYRSNKYFYRAIKKYGWDNFEHEIIFKELTKEEAEQKEIELIAYYQSNNKNYGYNIDNGGNCIGSFSEEHKRKISNALTGKPKMRGESHHSYGKHLSEATKRKISESKKGKPGRTVSNELKKKLSEIHKVPIIQYNLNGIKIREWESAYDASKNLGIHRTCITACCNGTLKTSGGFIWRHKGDELNIDDLDKHKPFRYQCKPINQYSIKGDFIKRYDSIKEAATENGFKNSSNILCCCKGKTRSAYGYVWKYADDEMKDMFNSIDLGIDMI